MSDNETNNEHDIVQITPCSGWSFRHQNEGEADALYPVAAWALLRDGSVIGLIPVQSAATHRHVARLVSPPPLGGSYELTSDDCEATISNIISGHEPRDRYRTGQDSETDHFARTDVREMLRQAYVQGRSGASSRNHG